MDVKDLRLKYKQETGRYPANEDTFNLPEGRFSSTDDGLLEYLIWLEQVIIENKFV